MESITICGEKTFRPALSALRTSDFLLREKKVTKESGPYVLTLAGFPQLNPVATGRFDESSTIRRTSNQPPCRIIPATVFRLGRTPREKDHCRSQLAGEFN